MNRNATARQHSFAVVPSPEFPRSRFTMRQTRKMAFDASDLIPIMCEEVLPGDTWQHTESIMARLATPIAPVVDDMDLETFYFYVPNRILWKDWKDFITGINTSVTVPTITPYYGGTYELLLGSVFDHMGLTPQTYAPDALKINVLPLWAYFKIWNEWFRDQSLQNEWTWPETWTSDISANIKQAGANWNMMPLRANKRSDMITRSLPWPQKGAAVSLPLGSYAPVISDFGHGGTGSPTFNIAGGGGTNRTLMGANATAATTWSSANTANGAALWNTPSLVADLTTATQVTINQIRLTSILQQMLERDARGGSRYVENILAHWGVHMPDKLYRPEYLGGSTIPITVNPVAQTATYNAAPSDEPSALGNLGAEMHASGHKKTFSYAAVEHGYIIGLAVVRATPTYQQGTRRHWKRTTRNDFWDPLFANLGEQAVNTYELYQSTTNTWTNATWGYQERGYEYRYTPNEITGLLRSTAPQSLDWWHYAEEFGAEPTLSASFMTDKTKETLARSLANAPSAQWGCQIIMDILHQSVVARLMPAYSVPGIDKL